MRAIASVLVFVSLQGALHAQPAPDPYPPAQPPSSQPYPGSQPPSATPPSPAPAAQPYPAQPYPAQPYPAQPAPPYPGSPYPAPTGHPYPPPPGVIPPYVYVPQLTEEEQGLLARGEISDGRYLGGALASVFFGFGVGQAVHGRYRDTGWIFTLGEGGTLTAMFIGVFQSLDACLDESDCSNDEGEALLLGGLIGFLAFRAWELVDAFGAPPRHNARVRELRMRLGLPPPMYTRIQPHVAPTMSRDGGGTAGLTLRF
jgi:hypothetical protein